MAVSLPCAVPEPLKTGRNQLATAKRGSAHLHSERDKRKHLGSMPHRQSQKKNAKEAPRTFHIELKKFVGPWTALRGWCEMKEGTAVARSGSRRVEVGSGRLMTRSQKKNSPPRVMRERRVAIRGG